jgi:hypothetical protein
MPLGSFIDFNTSDWSIVGKCSFDSGILDSFLAVYICENR